MVSVFRSIVIALVVVVYRRRRSKLEEKKPPEGNINPELRTLCNAVMLMSILHPVHIHKRYGGQ